MWKPIGDWEGWYEVSDTGQVRSVPRVVLFSDGRKRSYKGQVLSQYEDDFGYRKVTLKKNGKDFRVHVHILVSAAFHGPRPVGFVVRHLDNDHRNNRIKNLKYGTYEENSADQLRHGTRVRGVKTHNAVLTNASVKAMRAARGTITDIAEQFGVSRTTAWNVRNRKRWGWLP